MRGIKRERPDKQMIVSDGGWGEKWPVHLSPVALLILAGAKGSGGDESNSDERGERGMTGGLTAAAKGLLVSPVNRRIPVGGRFHPADRPSKKYENS